MGKKFIPNDTTKEERAYEPFQGAKTKFIKDLEEQEENKKEEDLR